MVAEGLELLMRASMLEVTDLKKQRTCATCMAEYSSGNWYKVFRFIDAGSHLSLR
jgi:hypothetical protein